MIISKKDKTVNKKVKKIVNPKWLNVDGFTKIIIAHEFLSQTKIKKVLSHTTDLLYKSIKWLNTMRKKNFLKIVWYQSNYLKATNSLSIYIISV
jgi:hypothetical protein